MRFVLLIWTLSAFAFSLSNKCPPSFKRQKGLCYYTSPYLTQGNPKGLSKGITVFQNGFNPKHIHLGKLLFFDPLLSKNKDLSCAHCHSPSLAFTDGRKTSLGKNQIELFRSAPSLWNVAFQEKFFWDGRASSLEEQLAGPLFNEKEMGNTPENLEKDLNANEEYRKLFFEAFQTRKITYPFVVKALTTFERTLVSLNSRYDQFALGKTNALTQEETEGHNIFRSFVARCTECHTPPLFTNSQMVNLGLPDNPLFPPDPGYEAVTKDARHRDHFKVPTLRNITMTGPYMHSGIFQTLEEVVHFYNLGGGREGTGKYSPYIHWHIRKMGLSTTEEKKLVTFLGSLTDNSNAPQIPSEVPSKLKVFQGEKK